MKQQADQQQTAGSPASSVNSQVSSSSQHPPQSFSISLLLSFPLRVYLCSIFSLLFLCVCHSLPACLTALISFCFFTLTSAPATGQPNIIEHVLYYLHTTYQRARSRSATSTVHTHTDEPYKPQMKRSVSLRFTVRSYHLHVHHWLYLSLLYTAALLFIPSSSVHIQHLIAGWCIGGICQGLKYDDWHQVMWRTTTGTVVMEAEQRDTVHHLTDAAHRTDVSE